MTAAITETCADVVRSRASAIKIGQPNTAPSAVKKSGRRRSFRTNFSRRIVKIKKEIMPAIVARPVAVKNGSKLSSAHFVMGTERAKRKMPIKAINTPTRISRRVSFIAEMRYLNFLKSGARFSVKAFPPSFASSVSV